MSIEYRDAVPRADYQPVFQACRVARKQRVQHERRKREIIDPVNMPGDVDLILIVRVDLHQHFDSSACACAVSSAMKSNVSGIMKQLVPGFLMAYPAASSRIARMRAAANSRRICSK